VLSPAVRLYKAAPADFLSFGLISKSSRFSSTSTQSSRFLRLRGLLKNHTLFVAGEMLSKFLPKNLRKPEKQVGVTEPKFCKSGDPTFLKARSFLGYIKRLLHQFKFN
jgi:hypothetical protein